MISFIIEIEDDHGRTVARSNGITVKEHDQALDVAKAAVHPWFDVAQAHELALAVNAWFDAAKADPDPVGRITVWELHSHLGVSYCAKQWSIKP